MPLFYIYIESTSALLLNWLYNVKIPSILKKMKAEMVLDLNGIASAKIKIPQLVAAGNAFFYSEPKQLNSIENYALKKNRHTEKAATEIIGSLDKKGKMMMPLIQEKLPWYLILRRKFSEHLNGMKNNGKSTTRR
jgi:hypothetical protein